jgi:hypothetical protein
LDASGNYATERCVGKVGRVRAGWLYTARRASCMRLGTGEHRARVLRTPEAAHPMSEALSTIARDRRTLRGTPIASNAWIPLPTSSRFGFSATPVSTIGLSALVLRAHGVMSGGAREECALRVSERTAATTAVKSEATGTEYITASGYKWRH